jgi:deazaflavin-dependent oxidoreductase (nitroreductase family)
MTTSQTQQEQHQLPPKPVRMVMNGIMKFILRSPLHGMVSDTIMIITFTGRKSGKTYSTPVTYIQQGSTITCFTRAPWWKNFKEEPQVKLRVRGEVLYGTATPVTDAGKVADGAREFIEQKGLENIERIGVMIDTDRAPTQQELINAVEGRVMIRIRTQGQSA